ncbi:MAG: hypothetical protein KatS3mg003_1372 [Candidatus Nitrosocaldaceae archaeon]|nr:MAG: hypothetical protein KatS3mg003_1372 [Candidatus Nitrosocaldaceae archaeon]
MEYEGYVYLYNTGYSEDMIEKSKEFLIKEGVKEEDIKVIDKPEDIPQGAIMVTIWAHNLEVTKVRKVVNGSIISTNLYNIELD